MRVNGTLRSFWPSNEEIENGAEPMEENQHQHPDNLLAFTQTLVADGVDQHHQPEDEIGDAERRHKKEEQNSNSPRYYSSNHSFTFLMVSLRFRSCPWTS